MNIKNLFLLSWKKLFAVLGIAVIGVVLHNLISARLRMEEIFFFILVVFALPIYLVISAIYSMIHKARSK